MFKMSDYSALYARVEGKLRLEGFQRDMPGYELLKKAIVIYKVYKLPKDKLIEEVGQTSLVPATQVDIERKNRTNTEQWMIEALKAVGNEDDLMVFIKDIASKI